MVLDDRVGLLVDEPERSAWLRRTLEVLLFQQVRRSHQRRKLFVLAVELDLFLGSFEHVIGCDVLLTSILSLPDWKVLARGLAFDLDHVDPLGHVLTLAVRRLVVSLHLLVVVRLSVSALDVVAMHAQHPGARAAAVEAVLRWIGLLHAHLLLYCFWKLVERHCGADVLVLQLKDVIVLLKDSRAKFVVRAAWSLLFMVCHQSVINFFVQLDR